MGGLGASGTNWAGPVLDHTGEKNLCMTGGEYPELGEGRASPSRGDCVGVGDVDRGAISEKGGGTGCSICVAISGEGAGVSGIVCGGVGAGLERICVTACG